MRLDAAAKLPPLARAEAEALLLGTPQSEDEALASPVRGGH
ncbi:hypothetical protein ABH920_008731 [Catenulispora sp. EB89]|nr:hypothetical protein [Catenulispora pinistramenti]